MIWSSIFTRTTDINRFEAGYCQNKGRTFMKPQHVFFPDMKPSVWKGLIILTHPHLESPEIPHGSKPSRRPLSSRAKALLIFMPSGAHSDTSSSNGARWRCSCRHASGVFAIQRYIMLYVPIRSAYNYNVCMCTPCLHRAWWLKSLKLT